MYRLFLFVLLVCLSLPAAAQIFGPVAVPVEEEEARARSNKWLTLEVSAGANLVTRRRPLREAVTTEGLRLGVGPRAGIKALFFPESGVRLVLGLDYLRDHGTILGYRKETISFFDQDTEDISPRVRTGDVTIRENFWRGSLGLGFALGPIDGQVAFYASGIFSGSQRYDYEETINAFQEPVTGQLIPLNPVLVRTGSRDFHSDFFGGYGGMTFELSYPFAERFRVQLEYEQGWHLDPEGGQFEEWRQRRSRMGVTVAYQLVALERR